MNVIVDTCVWSLALRRRKSSNEDATVMRLRELINESRAQLLGPIRQEILSGIASIQHFNTLKNYLSAFPDWVISSADHESAAMFCNQCRSKGIQGSNTDFLICAIASRHKMSIFTTDKDFTHYAKIIPLNLYPLA